MAAWPLAACGVAANVGVYRRIGYGPAGCVVHCCARMGRRHGRAGDGPGDAPGAGCCLADGAWLFRVHTTLAGRSVSGGRGYLGLGRANCCHINGAWGRAFLGRGHTYGPNYRTGAIVCACLVADARRGGARLLIYWFSLGPDWPCADPDALGAAGEFRRPASADVADACCRRRSGLADARALAGRGACHNCTGCRAAVVAANQRCFRRRAAGPDRAAKRATGRKVGPRTQPEILAPHDRLHAGRAASGPDRMA